MKLGAFVSLLLLVLAHNPVHAEGDPDIEPPTPTPIDAYTNKNVASSITGFNVLGLEKLYDNTFVGLVPAGAAVIRGNLHVTGFNLFKFSQAMNVRDQQGVNLPLLNAKALAVLDDGSTLVLGNFGGSQLVSALCPDGVDSTASIPQVISTKQSCPILFRYDKDFKCREVSLLATNDRHGETRPPTLDRCLAEGTAIATNGKDIWTGGWVDKNVQCYDQSYMREVPILFLKKGTKTTEMILEFCNFRSSTITVARLDKIAVAKDGTYIAVGGHFEGTKWDLAWINGARDQALQSNPPEGSVKVAFVGVWNTEHRDPDILWNEVHWEDNMVEVESLDIIESGDVLATYRDVSGGIKFQVLSKADGKVMGTPLSMGYADGKAKIAKVYPGKASGNTQYVFPVIFGPKEHALNDGRNIVARAETDLVLLTLSVAANGDVVVDKSKKVIAPSVKSGSILGFEPTGGHVAIDEANIVMLAQGRTEAALSSIVGVVNPQVSDEPDIIPPIEAEQVPKPTPPPPPPPTPTPTPTPTPKAPLIIPAPVAPENDSSVTWAIAAVVLMALGALSYFAYRHMQKRRAAVGPAFTQVQVEKEIYE